MSYMTQKNFWAQATERAAKTAAQVALSLLAVSVGGLLSVGYGPLLSVVGLAVVVSYLTSIVSGQVSPVGSASLVTAKSKAAVDGNGNPCPPGC